MLCVFMFRWLFACRSSARISPCFRSVCMDVGFGTSCPRIKARWLRKGRIWTRGHGMSSTPLSRPTVSVPFLSREEVIIKRCKYVCMCAFNRQTLVVDCRFNQHSQCNNMICRTYSKMEFVFINKICQLVHQHPFIWCVHFPPGWSRLKRLPRRCHGFVNVGLNKHTIDKW